MFNFEGPQRKDGRDAGFSCKAEAEKPREERKQEVRNAMCTAQRNLHKMVDNNILTREKQTCEYGGVAQLGEHLPCKQGVDSSILFISTSGWRRGMSRTKGNGWEQRFPAEGRERRAGSTNR